MLKAKLAAVVRRHWGEGDRVAGGFPDGATLRQGRRAWVHSSSPDRLVGGALLWALNGGVDELHLIVDRGAGSGPGSGPGMVARRAAAFAEPPAVWELDGADLRPAEPEPLPPEPPLPPDVAELAGVIVSAGAEPVVEHGMLLAEVRGLEVGRVEPAPGGPVLLVGVGRHDRQARALLDAGLPSAPGAAVDLARVVADVRARRVQGGPSHPATLLSAERWLRSAVVAHPELVGARSLTPASPARVRPNLVVRSPAPAVGLDGDGARVVVVCSTGVDPELVPAAADAHRAAAAVSPAHDPVRLVLALPEGDDHPLLRRSAAALAAPAEVRTAPADWRAQAP